MHKSTNFSGQPLLNQLLFFVNGSKIRKIAAKHNAERYVKKFDTQQHLIVMLFAVISGYKSLREVILGLLSNAHKLQHLGLKFVVKRSTLSDANIRRCSGVFGDIYMAIYREYASSLADSILNRLDIKRLYAMDSTTITLFKEILKGCGRNQKEGKKKGGIKAHTIIDMNNRMPCFVRYTESARHDHVLLKEVKLPEGSFIVFDRGYVDYVEYERFTNDKFFYVTRLKDNAIFENGEEFDIPESADNGILKDEKITLCYGNNGEMKHLCRRIAFWDDENKKLFVFVTNNFVMSAENIALIYKLRWKIELLFKQLKQNFELKYFLGDNQNAIEIQIWTAMLANLLLTLIKSKVKRKWAFSNMVSVVRSNLMNYVNIYRFLENPEGCLQAIMRANAQKYRNEPSLFPENQGAYF
jgi:transposase